MVCQVEELGSEFQMRFLRSLDFLEKREVEAVETGTYGLSVGTPQGTEIGLPDRGRRWWVLECRRVQPLVHVVLAADDVLSRHEQSEAAHACGRGGLTIEGHRLAVIHGPDPVGHPAAQNSILNPSCSGHEALAAACGKLVSSTQREGIADVKLRQPVVLVKAKTWDARRATDAHTSTAQQIAGIGASLGPRVGRQHIQSLREPPSVLRLERMVVTVGIGAGIG